jgi:hypothetical protein
MLCAATTDCCAIDLQTGRHARELVPLSASLLKHCHLHELVVCSTAALSKCCQAHTLSSTSSPVEASLGACLNSRCIVARSALVCRHTTARQHSVCWTHAAWCGHQVGNFRVSCTHLSLQAHVRFKPDCRHCNCCCCCLWCFDLTQDAPTPYAPDSIHAVTSRCHHECTQLCVCSMQLPALWQRGSSAVCVPLPHLV